MGTEVPHAAAPPVFVERPTEPIVRDAYALAAVPLLLALVAIGTGHVRGGVVLLGLAGFVFAFFRNPERAIPGDERTVVSPADGRVIAVGEIEEPDGGKRLRIGIFLSVFNVHVNRAPVAGRVVAVERRGNEYLPAFNPEVETRNVACAMTLETAQRECVRVVQITGVIARRIVCHPKVGEWIARGARYGLIRFGSRTDVVLPPGATARVAPGERVRGGSSVIATLGPPA
jgi:phosphatidylserine decarboxylase